MKKSHPKLVQLIREEFEERPELRLTVHEASQFWALDEAGCEHALVELAKRGFLAQDGDRRFRMQPEPRPVFGNDATVALRRLSRTTAWQRISKGKNRGRQCGFEAAGPSQLGSGA